jgi:two-component system, sensor histidine kinase and response regulator
LILVAEDHPTNRRVIQRQLALLGHAMEVAEDGAQALAMWRAGRYGLLLTDCQMPEMDGFELTRVIRAEEAAAGHGRRLPIAAVTANALEDEVQKCMAVGMDDSLSKPVDLNQLRRVLNRFLPLPETAAENGALSGEVAAQEIAEAAAPSAPVESPPLDVDALIAMFDGDSEFVFQLLGEFVASNASSYLWLRESLAAQIWGDVRQAAHKLAGSSRTVGARDLATVADAVEIAALELRLDGIDAMVERTGQELDRVIGWIKAAEPAPAPPP